MGAFFLDILAFYAKAAAITVSGVVLLSAIAGLIRRARRSSDGTLKVENIGDRFDDLAGGVRHAIVGRKEAKKHRKARAQERKKTKDQTRPRVFVLDFDGDMAASHVANLREEISAIVGFAGPTDEVVLRLESSGGLVHAYGLAASQLVRLKDKGVRLVACVDKVAASGGYMMACVAHEVIAAPFSIIGSIGVVAQVPNVHRLLQAKGVDYEEMTAGEFKRTISFLGQISPEGRKKFQEQLEDTHGLFKEFVKQHRPGADVDKISTGEYWFGTRAKELGLVDRLQTSDDYLQQKSQTSDVYLIAFTAPGAWRRRLGRAAATMLSDWLVGLRSNRALSHLPWG